MNDKEQTEQDLKEFDEVFPMTEEEHINEYAKNQGVLFRVKYVDRLRDGGTKVIQTSKPDIEYLIEKDNKWIARSINYNIQSYVTDPHELVYLQNRIKNYIEHLLDYMKLANALINDIDSIKK